jgi:mannan endo-1,4-beta-mannosidase
MLGEFDYGHDTDISHGIAIADLLGVLADKNVTIATRWDLNVNNDGVYTNAAYKLFRNYDGSNGGYGDMAVPTTFTHVDSASVWASVDTSSNDLHLIILNKDINNNRDFSIDLGSVHSHSIKGVYGFDGSSSDILVRPLIGALSGGKLDITLPELGAYHVVLTRN